MVIYFDFSTSDFEHAVQVCEVAFGFEGSEWERVKSIQDMEELSVFLKENEIYTETMYENS